MVRRERSLLSAWAALAAAIVMLGCGDGSSGDDPKPAKWELVFDDLPGALISVSGTSEHDVWTAGGNPGDGTGGFVLHFDGTRWQKLDTGKAVDFWWVHPFVDGPTFIGGSQGTILRYEGGAFTAMPTPGTATVFGIWGATPDNLWAVGGDPAKPGQAFVWRYDGTAWTAPSGMPSIPVSAYFKVWGRNADEVRIIGMDGVIVHYDAGTFSQPVSPTNNRLLTLHAEPGGPYVAVGGISTAVILESSGGDWIEQSPEKLTHAMIGVRLAGDDGYAVGTAATILHRTTEGWVEEELGFDVFADFHSVWIDDKGGVWAAGGDIMAFPLLNGVLVHKGRKIPGGTYE